VRALFLVPVAIALSGCAGWVVFGHTIEKPADSRSEPAAPQPVATQSATAPPVAAQPAAPQPAGAQPTAVAPSANQAVATETASIQPSPGPSRSLLKGVTVTLTPAARQKAATDRRFKEDALVAAIENELRARKLLAENDVKAERTVAVVIDGFATRPSSNAVVFGYIMSVGTLTGNVDVRAASGEELQTFRIAAKSRLATPTSGEDTQPLHALYSKFANLTVDDLSGTTRPDDVTNNEVPR
jgi:hypothetical protein